MNRKFVPMTIEDQQRVYSENKITLLVERPQSGFKPGRLYTVGASKRSVSLLVPRDYLRKH